MIYFDENHEWKDITWFKGFSPDLHSNFGMFKGNLVGMGGELGSSINLQSSGILKQTMKEKEVWVVPTMGDLEWDGPGKVGIG
jgi:hypothetical protein